jgi:hypothetical protein
MLQFGRDTVAPYSNFDVHQVRHALVLLVLCHDCCGWPRASNLLLGILA